MTMDISCDIIRDLLPLYAEDMVSNDSRGLVDAHLEGCDPCKKELELLKHAQKLPVDVDTHALERVSKEIRKRKILTVLCVIATIFSLIWSGMAFVLSPIYLNAEQAIEGVELREDGALAIDLADCIMGTGGRKYDNGDIVLATTTSRYNWWRARQEEKKLSGMTEEEIENYVKKLYSKKELSQADWDRFNSVQTRYCFTDVNGVLTIAYEPDFEGYFADDPFAPYTPAEHTYDLFYVEPGLKEPVLLWDGDDGQIYEDLTSLDFLVQQYLIFFGVSLVITISQLKFLYPLKTLAFPAFSPLRFGPFPSFFPLREEMRETFFRPSLQPYPAALRKFAWPLWWRGRKCSSWYLHQNVPAAPAHPWVLPREREGWSYMYASTDGSENHPYPRSSFGSIGIRC